MKILKEDSIFDVFIIHFIKILMGTFVFNSLVARLGKFSERINLQSTNEDDLGSNLSCNVGRERTKPEKLNYLNYGIT